DLKEKEKDAKARITGKVEGAMLDAITKFLKAKGTGVPDEMAAAVAKLDEFNGVEDLSQGTMKSYRDIRAELAKVRERQNLEKFKSRFADLQTEGRTKGADFLLDGEFKILSEDPPEEVAQEIRKDVSRL